MKRIESLAVSFVYSTITMTPKILTTFASTQGLEYTPEHLAASRSRCREVHTTSNHRPGFGGILGGQTFGSYGTAAFSYPRELQKAPTAGYSTAAVEAAIKGD